MIEHLNWRLAQRGYTPLKCGIGMSSGRALMIQAGYKGSGIFDVIWMGDVVNEAAKLCHMGNRDDSKPAQVSPGAFARLGPRNRNLLKPYSPVILGPVHYQGNFVSTEMSAWTARARGDRQNALTKLISSLGPAEEPGPLRSVSSWI